MIEPATIEQNLQKKITSLRMKLSPDARLLLSSVLPLLGMPCGPDVLQSSIACPFCDHKQFYLYVTAIGGHWHYCSHCRHSGDLVELAASVWKISIAATLKIFHEKGLIDEIPPLSNAMPGSLPIDPWAQRQAILTLWETASERARLGHGESLGVFRRKLGIDRASEGLGESEKYWVRGMGQLLGETTAKEVNDLFHSPGHKVKYPTLRGPSWKNVLVLPYCQAPDQMSAFLFLRAGGSRGKGDYTYKSFSTVRTPNMRDAGLWGLTSVSAPGDGWNDYVLAFEDQMLALQLQYQHLHEDAHMAPIVCWYDDPKQRTSITWQVLTNKKILFIAELPTPTLLRQVKMAKGRLAFCTTQYNDGTRFWKTGTMRDRVTKLGLQAQPLSLAMGDWLRQSTPADIEVLSLGCDRIDFDLRGELRACDRPLLDKVRTVAGETLRRLPSIEIPLAGKKLYKISENGNELLLVPTYNNKTPIVACNCILRIDRAILCPGKRQPIYEGRVLYKDQIFEFQVLASRLTNRLLAKKWLSQFLLMRTGMPLQVHKLIENELLKIALSFRIPDQVVGSSRVGWLESNQQFQLPNLLIGQPAPTMLVRTPLMPGKKFRRVEQPDFSAMRNNQVTQVFWAVLSLGITNILARRYDQHTAGIGLVGQGAVGVGKFVAHEILDIPTFAVRRGTTNGGDRASQMRHLENRHDWPIFVDGLTLANRSLRWFKRAGLVKNCISTLDQRLATGIQLLAPWRIVKSDKELKLMAWMHTEGPKIVPAYLEHICQNQPVFSTRKNLAKLVQQDLADWVGAREGEPQIVLNASNWWRLDLPTSVGRAVYDILMVAYIEDRIQHVRLDFESSVGLGVFTVPNGPQPGLIIPQETFARAASILGLGLISAEHVEQCLQESGYLLEYVSSGPRTGWLVNLDIWEECLKGL